MQNAYQSSRNYVNLRDKMTSLLKNQVDEILLKNIRVPTRLTM